MSELDLDTIEARANAATGGKWELEERQDGFAILSKIDGGLELAIYELDKPDAEFIAHAREDIPKLVAEVRRLRAENEHCRKLLGRLVTRYQEKTSLGWDLFLDDLVGDASEFLRGEWLFPSKRTRLPKE
jgi:hypothetical protein